MAVTKDAAAVALFLFSIFTGDAKTMYLKALYSNFGGPLDLTDCTQIAITLPNTDGTTTVLELTESEVVIQTPTVLGLFNAPISSEVSGVLNVGELQTFNVTFTIGSAVFTVPYVNSLTVEEP